jgi:hypothetical protein
MNRPIKFSTALIVLFCVLVIAIGALWYEFDYQQRISFSQDTLIAASTTVPTQAASTSTIITSTTTTGFTATVLAISTNTPFSLPTFTCPTCNSPVTVASGTYPYPSSSVAWTEYGAEINLVGVSLVETVSSGTSLYDSESGGDGLLTLFFKVRNASTTAMTSASYPVPENLRMITDEYGTAVSAINATASQQLPFNWTNEAEGGIIQSASFFIPNTATEFIFRTDANSDTYFDMDIGGDGAINSQMELTAEPQNTVTPPICGEVVRNVPGAYPTIQAAIDAADPGDTIQVGAGTYNESIIIKKSRICLEGAGIDQTIITPSGTTGIMVNGASYVTIRDLTVKGTSNYLGTQANGMGGGILTYEANYVSIQSCHLTQNSAYIGGGLYANHTTGLVMDHCLIDNNNATTVGGIYIEPESSGVFTNITVANNYASRDIGGFGYGIDQGSNITISHSILYGNTGPMSFIGNPALGNVITDGGSTNFAVYESKGNPSDVVSYSDIEGWSGGTDDIDADPMFTSSSDYHLEPGSLAADMGVYP